MRANQVLYHAYLYCTTTHPPPPVQHDHLLEGGLLELQLGGELLQQREHRGALALKRDALHHLVERARGGGGKGGAGVRARGRLTSAAMLLSALQSARWGLISDTHTTTGTHVRYPTTVTHIHQYVPCI